MWMRQLKQERFDFFALDLVLLKDDETTAAGTNNLTTSCFFTHIATDGNHYLNQGNCVYATVCANY